MKYNSAEEALEALVHAYYNERNMEDTLDCVTENIEWIGTEENDCARGKEDLKRLLMADIEAFPTPFEVELQEPFITQMGSDAAIMTVTGRQVEVPGVIAGFSISGTAGCIKTKEGWLVNYVHTIVSETDKQMIRDQMRFHTLIDDVPTGIGVYEVKDGKLQQNYVNNAFYRMLGSTREKRSKYFGENTMNAVHPDDAALVHKAMKRALAGENLIDVDYRLETENGKWFWVHLTGSVIERRENYIRVYAAISDYNSVKQKERNEEETRVTLDIAMKSAKIMVWKYDCRDNTITDTLTLGETYGLPKTLGNIPQSLIDMGFVSEESQPDFREFFTRVSIYEPATVDTKAIIDEEGNYIWYRIIDTPVYDGEGNYTGSIGTALDITEQKEKEQHYEDQLKLNKAATMDALAKVYVNLSKKSIISFDYTSNEYESHGRILDADELLTSIRTNIFDKNELNKFEAVTDCNAIIRAYKKGIAHHEIILHKHDTRWVKVLYDVLENAYTGDIEMISSIQDVTEQVRSDLVVHKLMDIAYKSILLVDNETGIAFPYKREDEDDNVDEINNNIEKTSSKQEGLEAFFRTHALPDKVEEVIQMNSPETIAKMLEIYPFYECMYALIENGKFSQYKVIYSYLEDDKRILLSAVQDVTKVYEKEILQNNKLTIALAEADAANKAKTAFLSRISHDMRTPLNGILGITTLLKDSLTDQNVLRDLSQLENSGNYLLNLINDTLDVSRIESGKLELNPIVTEGRTFFNNAMELARVNIESKNVHYHFHAEDLPFTILYDDIARLEQIIMNVVSNAVKFTPEGGNIDITVKNISVEDGVITDQIIVEDNGIGMSPEFIPHIFEAFSQEDASRTTSSQGTGLGMSITSQLLQLMGGDISVESELGKGTCVTLTIKLHIATEEQIAEWEKNKDALKYGMDLSGKRVLLCEDHPLNAQIAIRLLKAKGMIVEHAENGRIGLSMFNHSITGYYDAVLMDIRMPVMDGLDTARAIRNLPRRDARMIPIIAMTANAFKDDVESTKNAGMDAHLSKPIEKDVLYKTLAQFIKVDYISRKQKVLIVDDIEINRAAIKASLEDDYEIMEAVNGKEALDIMKNTKGIDVVITDIQMPEMDGVELVRQLRSDPGNRHLAILANTQFGDQKQEEELLDLGANDFIYKPTTPKILEVRVRNALRRM